MKHAGWFGLILSALVLLAISVSADELGLITIDNSNQAVTATRLLDHALVRIDNRFLVAITPELKDSLAQSGIVYEVVLSNVRTDRISLVQSHDRRPSPTVDVSSLGRTVPLGGGLFLAETTPFSAASAAEQNRLFVRSLTDLSVAIIYQPKTAVFRLSPEEAYPTDTLISKIRKDSIYAYDRRLETFYTRYIFSDSIDKARDWIAAKFRAWGYTQVTTPTFTYGGGTHYNIKVVKPGYAEPDKVIVIGGHYDAINFQSSGYVYCPGSDDDASGVALTMEVARVLAKVPLRKTVVFMPFSAEEVGLVGSDAAAKDFRSAGTKLEAMFNYDMVGYNADSLHTLNIASGPVTAYRALTADAAARLTTLLTAVTDMGSSSDHYSFYQQGYPIVDNIEEDFNTEGWHTNLDLTSRMDFNYLTEVTKVALASVAATAMTAYPTSVDTIMDVGDGQSLQVHFTPCNTGYQYTVYYGTTSGHYTDSVSVPLGSCTQIISGLAEGSRYYFAVTGKPADGYRALTGSEGSETPLLVPRTPQSVVAGPEERRIILDWRDNTELDLASYNIYRKMDFETGYDLLASGLTTSSFVDSVVSSGVLYRYVITAVDQTGHESGYSTEVNSYPATFDGGILVVDEMTQDENYLPDEAHQAAYFDSALGGSVRGLKVLNRTPDRLDKSTAGRYSTIVYDDDDLFYKIIDSSKTTLAWFLSHNVNMFLCGINTITHWSRTPVPTSHMLYSEFMVSKYDYTNFDYFTQANGQNGWPSIQWDTTRGLGYLWEVPVLTVRSGGTAILLNDSPTNNATTEGKPIGVAYSGTHGKRVIISVPLYYLTPASATALMAKVKEYFGESTRPIPNGDINGSGFVDLTDLSILVSYLTGNTPVLPLPNGGDVDHSCFVDLSDLSRLISYLTTGKPALQAGCVTP